MSIRKREWKTRRGEKREAWIVDYFDQQGVRRLKTFKRKKDAADFGATAAVQIREGTHVADSASVTVKEAGELWIKSAEAAGLERTTLDQYRQHLRLHIEPFLGRTKLSQLTAPAVRGFEDTLRAEGRSPSMVKYTIRSLGALLADAQDRGFVVRNSVRERRRHKGRDRSEDRIRRKLSVGVDIPTRAEIRSLVEAAKEPWRPLLITAIFTGLRSSELRGLRWDDVDLNRREVHVRQRADRYRAIGKPKTEAGERAIPLPPIVISTLREWKLKCPNSNLGLVFPNGKGNVEFHVNIIERGLKPTMIAAGVTLPVSGKQAAQMFAESGQRLVTPKYTGLHTLRHFFASWCINSREDGGLQLLPKRVQELMGHSSITVTMDRYGHLFPQGDSAVSLRVAERLLLG